MNEISEKSTGDGTVVQPKETSNKKSLEEKYKKEAKKFLESVNSKTKTGRKFDSKERLLEFKKRMIKYVSELGRKLGEKISCHIAIFIAYCIAMKEEFQIIPYPGLLNAPRRDMDWYMSSMQYGLERKAIFGELDKRNFTRLLQSMDTGLVIVSLSSYARCATREETHKMELKEERMARKMRLRALNRKSQEKNNDVKEHNDVEESNHEPTIAVSPEGALRMEEYRRFYDIYDEAIVYIRRCGLRAQGLMETEYNNLVMSYHKLSEEEKKLVGALPKKVNLIFSQ